MGVLRITGPSPIQAILTGPKQASKEEPERMVRPMDAGEDKAGSGKGSSTEGAAAQYTLNLAKLIPGEALSLYALGGNVKVPDEVADVRVLPLLCLAAAVIFRWVTTRKAGSIWPQWRAVLIAAISFVLWIYAQNDWFLSWELNPNYQHIVKYILMFWVFVIPALVGESLNKRE